MSTKKQSFDLNKKAKELLERAEGSEVEQEYTFVTTFARYQMQLKILNKLEAEINQAMQENRTMVSVTYVKGRENLRVNPAITEYGKQCSIANQTAQTLMKIITTLGSKTLGGAGMNDMELFDKFTSDG